MCRLSVALRRSMCALLPDRGVRETVLFTITLAILTHGLSINRIGHPDIVAKTRVELRPIKINAFLNDIMRISAPMINAKAVYYMHKPNGDAMKLDIGQPKLNHIKIHQELQPIVARFLKNIKPIIQQENNYDAFGLTRERLEKMEEDDIMIGPLTAEDHGNWVLSVFTKDFNDDWVELFQIITVSIVEYVPLSISKVSPDSKVNLDLDRRRSLNVGETLHISIAFPIPGVESCELVAPRSTFDRFYDRTRINMATCGYILPNVTVEDAGLWKIIAVGKMIFEGEINLNVVAKSTKTKLVID